LGVPARYIHTHNAVIDVADLKSCVDLAVALVRKLDAKTVAALTEVL
jgi:endoglucanase